MKYWLLSDDPFKEVQMEVPARMAKYGKFYVLYFEDDLDMARRAFAMLKPVYRHLKLIDDNGQVYGQIFQPNLVMPQPKNRTRP